jgi:hypothetical protein
MNWKLIFKGILLVFEDKRSVMCWEIFTEGVRPVLKVEMVLQGFCEIRLSSTAGYKLTVNSWWMQASCVIQLPCSGTWLVVHSVCRQLSDKESWSSKLPCHETGKKHLKVELFHEPTYTRACFHTLLFSVAHLIKGFNNIMSLECVISPIRVEQGRDAN